MNIFSSFVIAPEDTTTINNNNNIKESVSLAELNASLTTWCGLTSGCYGRDGVQVRKVAVRILNKHVVNFSLLVGRSANNSKL